MLVEARNSVVTAADPTGHAETNLVRLAGPLAARQQIDLSTCTLYTSTEPCAMCSGAIYWSGIGRVVYALAEEDLLTMTGGDHPDNPTLALPCRQVFAAGSRSVVVDGPALEAEALPCTTASGTDRSPIHRVDRSRREPEPPGRRLNGVEGRGSPGPEPGEAHR